ncbi:MAG: tetratricopeptide repeat protein [Acidobacteria bacterium]|nr:tetratricopeptide repeat protein [Acidobacteriota bacterium]
MDRDRWKKLETVFEAALPLAEEARRLYLEQTAAGDPDLLASVLGLLSAHEAGNEYLDRQSPPPPSAAGPYRIESLIGRGGMGTVYLASRADDRFERKVAVKFLAPGLGGVDVASRFLREHRILAKLEHPNIARLLDAGATVDGVPFLVMEYVEGVRLDQWRREGRPTLTERLTLFRKLCDAVAFAHRALVVHRDIKPANVLVTPDGEPKLVDFGIAKLLDADGGELTGPSRAAFTLAYASPEQTEGHPVSTTTDVYALGVILYELLAGRHPVDRDPAQPAAFLHALANGDPVKPSVHERLPEDLDAIALKALSREPALRYQSADELARDVARFLDNRPVSARPPSAFYRTLKFVQRHRAASAFALAAVLSLAAGAFAAFWQAGQARREARIAEETNRFVLEMLSAASPYSGGGRDVTVAASLDSAVRRAGFELKDAPEVHAAVLGAAGNAYLGLGLHEEAEKTLEMALGIAREFFGAGSPQAARHLLARAAARQGKGDLEGAERDSREALTAFERGGDPQDEARALNSLGSTILLRGDVGGSERAHREALSRLSAAGLLESVLATATLNDLAVALGTAGRAAEAIPFHRQAYETIRRLRPPLHPDIANGASPLAALLADHTDRFDEAAQLFREAISIRRQALGNSHPDLMWSLYNYAFFLVDRKDYARAGELVTEVLAQRGGTLAAVHPLVAASLFLRGRIALEQGRAAQAIVPLEEALALRRQTLKPDHWLIATTLSWLGQAYGASGRRREGESLLRQGHKQLAASLGPDHPRARQALQRLEQFLAH